MSIKQDHKRWRKQFNEDCLNRDNHKCRFCDEIFSLDVHHITDRREMPNGGYVLSNGITVCDKHHLLCEEWHYMGYGLIEYKPENLYSMIGSSYQQALIDSQNLK